MNRTLIYTINETETGFPIKKYLKNQGYSSRSLVELKKFPESVLVNGTERHMNFPLEAGDILTIQIQEDCSSEKIPPRRASSGHCIRGRRLTGCQQTCRHAHPSFHEPLRKFSGERAGMVFCYTE